MNKTVASFFSLAVSLLVTLAGTGCIATPETAGSEDETSADSEFGWTNGWCTADAPPPSIKLSPNGSRYCWVTTSVNVVQTGCKGGFLYGDLTDGSGKWLTGRTGENAVYLSHKTSHERGRTVCRTTYATYLVNGHHMSTDVSNEVCKTVKC